MNQGATLMFVALGIALFVTIWIAVSLVLSSAGGWWALARVYRARQPAPRKGWIERRVLLSGRALYKNVLRMSASHAGIHLSVAFPFRVGHPPLLIPWQDLFSVPSASCPLGYTELRFRRVASPRVLVPDAALRRLDESAPGPWRSP